MVAVTVRASPLAAAARRARCVRCRATAEPLVGGPGPARPEEPKVVPNVKIYEAAASAGFASVAAKMTLDGASLVASRHPELAAAKLAELLPFVAFAGYNILGLAVATGTLALGAPRGCAVAGYTAVLLLRLAYVSFVLKLAVPAAGVAMVAVLTAATAYAAATDRFESHQLQAAAAATLAAGGAAFWLGLVGPAGARPPTSPEALFFSGLVGVVMWAGAALFAALASGKSGTTATWAATVPLVANLALRAASGGSPPPPFAAVFGVLCVAGAYLGYKNAFA